MFNRQERRPGVHTGLARRSGQFAILGLVFACSGNNRTPPPTLDESERATAAREVEARLREATDLSSGGDVVARLLSIYPDSGSVVSAAGGRVSTERDSLEASVRGFWTVVGRNMRDPEWRWGPMHVDVLASDAAVVTASYSIPHLTPDGDPHVVGGAWTAVFQKRGEQWVVIQEHLSDVIEPVSQLPE